MSTVRVRLLNEATITLHVDPLTTIGELKKKIAEQSKYLEQQLRLIYRSMQLADQFSLQHYDIREGSTIHQVRSLSRGGCPEPRIFEYECPICLEDIENISKLKSAVPCGHLLCCECTNKVEICPICDAQIDKFHSY
jgi:hypothetical protein